VRREDKKSPPPDGVVPRHAPLYPGAGWLGSMPAPFTGRDDRDNARLRGLVAFVPVLGESH
jgi:hypothetical protein